MDLQNEAVSEGARKALEEEVARERQSHRKKAKQALQRKRIEHEAALIRQQVNNTEEGRKQQEAIDSSRRRLAEELQRVDRELSNKKKKKRPEKSWSLPTRPDEIAKKKKDIAALRKQAARENWLETIID